MFKNAKSFSKWSDDLFGLLVDWREVHMKIKLPTIRAIFLPNALLKATLNQQNGKTSMPLASEKGDLKLLSLF